MAKARQLPCPCAGYLGYLFYKSGLMMTCIGYLDHPVKNKPFETEKEILSLLANTGGSV
jgi:hypothetical protein